MINLIIRNLMIWTCAVVILLAVPVNAQPVEFERPTHEGYPVDFCLTWAENCGQPAADNFCRTHGFARAAEWSVMRDIGISYVLGDDRVCDHPNCDAFETITCIRRGTVSRGRGEGQSVPPLPTLDQITPIPTEPSPTIVLAPGILIPRINGCEAGEGKNYVCTNIGAYQECRSHLHDGTVSSCRAQVVSEGSLIQFEPAAPSEFAMAQSSTAAIIVYRGSRGWAETSGEASWNVRFDRPAEHANPGCNPNTPVSNVADCRRRCVLMDRYTYDIDGPSGGLFAIRRLDSCDARVRVTRAPHEDHHYMAWDACESQNAWGQELNLTMTVRMAPLYHMTDPHTSFSGNTWHFEDAADVIAPFIDAVAPVRVTCVGG